MVETENFPSIRSAQCNKKVVTNAILGSSNCEVKLDLGENVDSKALTLRMNPLPVGENGELATHWASTLPLSASNDIAQIQIR